MIERITVMSCEGCDGENWVGGRNAVEVRREARAQGWRVSKKHGDYCPDCNEPGDADDRAIAAINALRRR